VYGGGSDIVAAVSDDGKMLNVEVMLKMRRREVCEEKWSVWL
jgi:hypothetical protein